MASYSVLFVDKNGNGITGKGIEGDIPYGTRKLVFWNTGVEFHDNWNFLDSVNWDDNYQGTSVESITYNGTEVSDGEEVDYSDGNIEIVVGYEYTPSNPGGGGGGGNTGDNTGGSVDTTPMIVTFNYYVNGKLVDDTTFEQIEMDMGRPIDEIWPRTLECYHIRFDKINPVEDSNPGTSSNTSYNSIEFTYIYEQKFDENELVNNWPYTGTLNNYKLIHAFSDTYFSGENCVTINGIGYNPGESFTENHTPIFHSNNTKTLEVNLYYTAVEVSTLVQSYNVDTVKYLEPDLWGYVSTQLGTRIFNDSFITTYSKIKYPVPLTSGNSVYCKARAKAGFEFSKWVSTSNPISGIESISNYEKLKEKERREAVLALPSVESIDTDLPNTEIELSGYRSNSITAVFKGLKNEVKLYKGLDFNGGDTYYIWGGDNKWKNSVNSDVKIKIPTREGAKLLGWVEYEQDGGTGEHPTIRRSQYQEAISLYKTQEEAFNVICLFNEKIIKGVIRINNPDDKTPEVVLLSGVDGYTDRYGNWLTGNKTLYPLWIVEEYPITYVSEGEDDLVVDETDIDEENGQRYVLKPEDYKLPLTYTIVGDNECKDIVFKALEKQGDKAFPEYKSFDRWEPSEIKKFTKTGEQTIVAHWVLDTYKITLEKNNNYANQSVKIKAGKSVFDKGINNPTKRTAYKSFEGWYTENNETTKNGTGDLIIDKDGKLQPGVEGFTDSKGRWIKKENTTVYAKWTPEEYTITYIIDGEDEHITRKYTIEDTKPKWYNLLSDPFGNLAPEGHYLDGWYTNENYSGSKVSVLKNGTIRDKTFYGRYKPFEYNIEYYNINENLCNNYEDLPVKHTYGTETKLIKPNMYLHDFLDWYTDENFENPITSIPSDYTIISTGGIEFGTIKLYGKYKLKLIPISYKDSNGNELTETSFNSAPPISYDYDNGTQLVRAHKNGYRFDGWYDNIGCTGKSFMFLDKEKYTTAVVLYCKFTPILYSITYYVDGIKNTNTGNPSLYTVEDLPITLKSLTKEGYNSTGWRLNSVSGAQYTQIAAGSTGNKAFYWTWTANVVTITWDANGGSVSQTSSTYTYNGDAISIPTPQSRTGYTFNGWFTEKTGGTKITDVGVNNKPTKNITYYAQWSKQSYTLTWNPNGGTIPSSPAYTSGNVEYGTSITKPGNPTKNYYVFTNWKDQYGNTGVASTMPAKNLTYTAQYEGKTITIKWNPNCSELTTLIETYKYGEPVEPQNLIRTGYVFVGWSTTQDGSNIQSTFGGTTVTADSITYYAVWNSGTGIKYTVKHYKQTLDGTYPTNLCVTEEHYGTTGNSVTPSVKNYTGFTSPTPKTVTIAADGSTVVEYYYTRNKYNISWNANGGELTGDYTNGNVYFETPIIIPNDPIKEGYTFTGWNPSVPEIMPANDIEFTASYDYEIIEITPVEVDFNLETVNANKIATNKWLHNVLGEPEQTSWGNLSNIFKTDFGSSITGECVTVSDLGYFITTQSQYKCKKQNETAAIFSNLTTSSSQKQNKYYELLKMNSKLGSIEFKVTPVASTANVPNYPGTDGFIMYFSVGTNPKLYKATIPVNRTCRLQFRAVRTNDILAIHRIPCYYGNSTNKIIVPVIYMANNSSNVHKLYSNTVLLQQAVNR